MRTSAIAVALDAAEMKTGVRRAAALNALALQVDGEVQSAKDGALVNTMGACIPMHPCDAYESTL